GARLGPRHVARVADELLRLGRVVVHAGEVAADAVPEALRLADVDDAAAAVAHEVDAGAVGEVDEDLVADAGEVGGLAAGLAVAPALEGEEVLDRLDAELDAHPLDEQEQQLRRGLGVAEGAVAPVDD